MPAADAGTVHTKLVELALNGALKRPLAVQFAPLVTVWFPPVRTNRTVSPGATVIDAGLNENPDCVTVCLVALAEAATSNVRKAAVVVACFMKTSDAAWQSTAANTSVRCMFLKKSKGARLAGEIEESTRIGYSPAMATSSTSARRATAIGLLACTGFGLMTTLAGCDGPTGGYPPPPPEYQAPTEALTAGKSPKFRPLIEALLTQRQAAAALAAVKTGDAAKAQELFAASREASRFVGETVAQANLTEEEKRQWNAITALEDAQLAELLKQ